jgi:hypothetical protein
LASEKLGLVEAAGAEAGRMKGNGEEEVEGGEVVGKMGKDKSGESRGEVGNVGVFEALDGGLEGVAVGGDGVEAVG